MVGKGTKEISVFVDESGTFSSDSSSSHFYVICMVFHDQDDAIDEAIEKLNESLCASGLDGEHAVHAGPLIRWEEPYRHFRRQDRRIIFSKMLAFFRHVNIKYRCFFVDKRFVDTTISLHDSLLQQVVSFLIKHAAELNEYDKLKIYYDNGQHDVLEILRDAFALFSAKIEFVSEVSPSKYKLFQLADFICTLELVRLKLDSDKRISSAEKDFFLSIQNLKRNFLKPMLRKIWSL